MSNATCFDKKAPQQGPPLFDNGHIIIQAHDIGWMVSGVFAIIATAVSLWLVNKHLRWYTNKHEQRYIIRLLFMVPLYSIISLASYLWWDDATPLLLLRDGYESTVLTAFFYLLLLYLSPDPNEQKAIFMKVGLSRAADAEARRKGEKVKGWVFPLGFVKAKPADGLYFLQMMKWGVLQYCVVRPTTTLIAVILNYVGLYCDSSWSLGWGYVWITSIVSISVSVAMYCLIQLYVPIAPYLAPQKPLLKLFAIKAVVFLTFWQATFLSMLSLFGVVKDTQYMTAADINIGWGAILETFEMVIFAILHIKAFTYKPYATPPAKPTPRLRSLGHAFDFRETLRELWISCVYFLDRARGREPRYDKAARRVAMLEDAFGQARPRADENTVRRDIRVEVKEEVEVEMGGERQWLGLGDNYAYGLGRREKSEGLEEEIEKELEKRGVTSRRSRNRVGDMDAEAQHVPQHSWWRSLYARLSQSGADPVEESLTPAPRRAARSHSRTHSRDVRKALLRAHEYDYDDPPPPSTIRQHNAKNHDRSLPAPPDLSPSQFTSPNAVRRSDSLLGRVFNASPGTLSAVPLTTQSKSALSHDTRVQVLPQHAALVFVPEGEREEMSLLQEDLLESPVQLDEIIVGAHDLISSPREVGTNKETSFLPPPLPHPSLPLSQSQISNSKDTALPPRPSHRRESAHYRKSFLAASQSLPPPKPKPIVMAQHIPSGPSFPPQLSELSVQGATTSSRPPAKSRTQISPRSNGMPSPHTTSKIQTRERSSEVVPTPSSLHPAPLNPSRPSHRPVPSTNTNTQRRSSAPLGSLPIPISTLARSTHRPRHSIDVPVSPARNAGAMASSSFTSGGRRSSHFSRFQLRDNSIDLPLDISYPRRPAASSPAPVSSRVHEPPSRQYTRPNALSNSRRPFS